MDTTYMVMLKKVKQNSQLHLEEITKDTIIITIITKKHIQPNVKQNTFQHLKNTKEAQLNLKKFRITTL